MNRSMNQIAIQKETMQRRNNRFLSSTPPSNAPRRRGITNYKSPREKKTSEFATSNYFSEQRFDQVDRSAANSRSETVDFMNTPDRSYSLVVRFDLIEPNG